MGSIVSADRMRSGSGFRVIVKNLSTRKSVVTRPEMQGGIINSPWLTRKTARAAQIGDILEISVRSPDPRIGVQPLRYTVTPEDVKQSRIELDNLVVYEIPTETELLANYPESIQSRDVDTISVGGGRFCNPDHLRCNRGSCPKHRCRL